MIFKGPLEEYIKGIAKKFALTKEKEAIKSVAPHCDSSVLHRPGKCQHCDNYPGWQEYREIARINFSNEHDKDKAPCPSTYFRKEETINKWWGNVEQKEIHTHIYYAPKPVDKWPTYEDINWPKYIDNWSNNPAEEVILEDEIDEADYF